MSVTVQLCSKVADSCIVNIFRLFVSSNTTTDTAEIVCWYLTAGLKAWRLEIVLFGNIFVNETCPQQAALYGNFKGADYANNKISQTHTSSWTGGIHKAETSDLLQVCVAWGPLCPLIWLMTKCLQN